MLAANTFPTTAFSSSAKSVPYDITQYDASQYQYQSPADTTFYRHDPYAAPSGQVPSGPFHSGQIATGPIPEAPSCMQTQPSATVPFWSTPYEYTPYAPFTPAEQIQQVPQQAFAVPQQVMPQQVMPQQVVPQQVVPQQVVQQQVAMPQQVVQQQVAVPQQAFAQAWYVPAPPAYSMATLAEPQAPPQELKEEAREVSSPSLFDGCRSKSERRKLAILVITKGLQQGKNRTYGAARRKMTKWAQLQGVCKDDLQMMVEYLNELCLAGATYECDAAGVPASALAVGVSENAVRHVAHLLCLDETWEGCLTYLTPAECHARRAKKDEQA